MLHQRERNRLISIFVTGLAHRVPQLVAKAIVLVKRVEIITNSLDFLSDASDDAVVVLLAYISLSTEDFSLSICEDCAVLRFFSLMFIIATVTTPVPQTVASLVASGREINY